VARALLFAAFDFAFSCCEKSVLIEAEQRLSADPFV